MHAVVKIIGIIVMAASSTNGKVTCHTHINDSAQSLAQEPADKYKFDRQEIYTDVQAGFHKLTALLEQAIADGAPDDIVVRLRFECALVANAWASRDKGYERVINVLRPLIDEPTPSLGNFELASIYVEMIKLWCNAFDADVTKRHDETIKTAIEIVNGAMALTENERHVLECDLRVLAAFHAFRDKDFESAVELLSSIVSTGPILVESSDGARIYCDVIREYSRSLARLKRLKESVAAANDAMDVLENAMRLPESERLIIASRIHASQLRSFSAFATEPEATQVWDAAQQHWSTLEEFDGDNMLDVLANGLEVPNASMSFLADRDYDRSTELADRICRVFEQKAELAKVERATNWAAYTWLNYLKGLSKKDTSLARQQRDHFIEFLDKLEDAGGGGRIKYFKKEAMELF